MTRELALDHAEAKKWPTLHGPNYWPKSADLPHFRETVTSYFDAVRSLGPRVMRIIAMALDLPSDYFASPGYFDEPLVTLGANHYSSRESVPSEGLLGIGAHTDYGALTFLATDEVPGLQISPSGHNTTTNEIGLRAEGAVATEWIDVQPMKGAFVVNMGDMMERWTNGRLPSTLHRVVNKSGKERFSLALFFEPNADCVVEVLPTCFDAKDDPPRFSRVERYGDWLQAKFDATGGG